LHPFHTQLVWAILTRAILFRIEIKEENEQCRFSGAYKTHTTNPQGIKMNTDGNWELHQLQTIGKELLPWAKYQKTCLHEAAVRIHTFIHKVKLKQAKKQCLEDLKLLENSKNPISSQHLFQYDRRKHCNTCASKLGSRTGYFYSKTVSFSLGIRIPSRHATAWWNQRLSLLQSLISTHQVCTIIVWV